MNKTNQLESACLPGDPQRRRLLQCLLAATGVLALGKGQWAQAATAIGQSVADGALGNVLIVRFDDSGKRLDEQWLPMVVKTEVQWQQQLSPLAYEVTRKDGTERAFSGNYNKPTNPGIFRCVCCDTALFNADTEFHSGTGWPSFWQPIAKQNVVERVDDSFGMRRTAVSCARCAAHLGHVFDDGPPPTGLRYCMNSVALRFAAAHSTATQLPAASG